NDGPVIVTGNATVAPGAALAAVFAHNDHSTSGSSSLTVQGNIIVGRGATLDLGCGAPDGQCQDDTGTTPTLTSTGTVGGDILATNALGVLIHNSSVAGDIVDVGGGGGLTCAPSSVFPAFSFGVFSDIEDSTVGGNVWIAGLTSCWLGALRNHVSGSISSVHNTMADPDANEVLTNQVRGNVICRGNSPANQYGDSHGMPNIVGGFGAGECAFGVRTPNPAPAGPLTAISVAATTSPGYDLGAADGGLFTFGTTFFGSAAGTPVTNPYVGLATAPGGRGYWFANSNGAISNFGPNGRLLGSAAGLPLAKPVVGIAAAPGGDGYWEAAGDGGVFAWGAGAPFLGSAGAIHLTKPVVGIAAVTTGDGYDLVAADGGVFTFGPGARFHGSLGNLKLNAPVVGMVMDPATGGYWLVAADGGVFSFDAPFWGSLGNIHLAQPIVGIAAAPSGNGYYLVAKDGGVFALGPGAHFLGSLGNLRLAAPVVGMGLG
ncbi:MAG TPA: hypothetical protein VGL49_04725, partial [Acidimicrobiales bacterium]